MSCCPERDAGGCRGYCDPELTKPDIVNSPAHYQSEGVETIDVIEAWLGGAEFQGYLRGNVVKYVSRCMRKGDCLNDLKKARWYLDRLIGEIEGGDRDAS